MNPHLFVDGSLLSTAGHPAGERLARAARRIAEASLQGRLYSISWYPGLVERDAEDQRVYGEVYRLHDAARSLQWLDAYEGLTVGGPHHGEYARRERPVRLTCGTMMRTWVYLYLQDVSGLQPLPGGRWVRGAR